MNPSLCVLCQSAPGEISSLLVIGWVIETCKPCSKIGLVKALDILADRGIQRPPPRAGLHEGLLLFGYDRDLAVDSVGASRHKEPEA